MVKYITFGSKFLDDAIVSNKKALSNELRIVGVSPFSITRTCELHFPLNSYQAKMLNMEAKDGIKQETIKRKYDYFIIDFLSCSDMLYEFQDEDNGEKYNFTKNNFLTDNLSNLNKKYGLKLMREIDPLEFSDAEIKARISELAEYLLTFIDSTRIVLVKWQIPLQYKDGENFVLSDPIKVGKINNLIRKCETCFEEKIECSKIEMPLNLVRDSVAITGNEISFAQYCKEYLAQMMSNIQRLKNTNDLYEKYELARSDFLKKYGSGMKQTLISFSGEYHDCFNNHIISNTPCEIEIDGSNSKIVIEESQADRLKITIGNNAYIEIGKGTTFAEMCHLICKNHKLILGADDMFSTKVICEAVDDDIIIGDHVWLGYQVKIRSSARIENGSIAGARSIVSTHVPNNCIVVGEKGRVVRKDIYWEREPYTDFIEKEQYAHFTEE